VKTHAWILSAVLAVPTVLAAQTTSSLQHSSGTDQDGFFLHTLASEDQSEIHLAKLALDKSHNPQVRQYAKSKILAADPDMKKEAQQLAQQIDLSITTDPDAKMRAEYQTLSRLSGEPFDQAYAKYESHKQQADLTTVQNETVTATNSKVRNFALKEEKPVGEAAQSAQQLAESLHAK
jgi:predicted outer membrane protein